MTALTLPRFNGRAISIHPLAIITVLGLGLRLRLIGQAQLWYDESGSLWMVSLPFVRMVAATAGDAHPPLYLTLLWAWVRLAGSSEAAVRLPSAIASVLCIPLTYAIAKRLQFSRAVSLSAAVLVAVLPAQLYYAQEARMYSLLTLEVSVALYAALTRRWWLLGLALTAGYWTHNYGLLFAVPINLAALWQIRTDLRGASRSIISAEMAWWFVVNVAAVAAWFPWFAVLVGQMREVAAGYWLQPVTPGAALYAMYMIVWAFSPGAALQAHAALLAFGAVTFATWRALRVRHAGAVWCAAVVATAFAVPIVLSITWRPVLLFRGLLPASIPLCILFAWAFVDGLTARRRLAVALLAAPTLLAAGVLYYVNVPEQKGDAAILKYIDWRPGDVVYHANDGSLQIAHVYAPATWPQYELPAVGWRDVGALSPVTRDAYGVQVASLDSLTWRRAWLVYAANPMTAAAEDQAITDLLQRYFHQVIYEHRDTMTHQAIYLLWNRTEGVP